MRLDPAPMHKLRTTAGRVLSLNWSGYALQGKFTEVHATFTVPHVWSNGYVAEWVGIDGYSNQDLIQAGVDASDFNGQQSTSCWWEILPSVSVNIPWMQCEPGDQVTVGIRNEGSGQWAIDILDRASGQDFFQMFPYNGPAASAEWIVEAPEVFWSIANILPFTPVTFTDLGAQGRAGIVDDIWLAQNGLLQSVASSVPSARQLMKGGFTVSYIG